MSTRRSGGARPRLSGGHHSHRRRHLVALYSPRPLSCGVRACGRACGGAGVRLNSPWFVAAGVRDPHLPWRYPGQFGRAYPAQVPYTNHSDVPDDQLAPMAWQYRLRRISAPTGILDC